MMPIIREIVSSSLFRTGVPILWLGSCSCSTKTTIIKAPESQQWLENQATAKAQGQPTPATHPHLLQKGEVLPGLMLEEFQERRCRLMASIHKHSSKHNINTSHLVVIPSATKVYMTEKIPYAFRQNTDFLYLSGCLEPDSALVLASHGGTEDCAEVTLFLRERDTHSERWDGPRTGLNEAPHMFGVNRALPLGQMLSFLLAFARGNHNFTLWYDFMQPIQPDIHKTMRDFLSDTWNKMWESPKPLIQRLRLYKSPAEVALMQSSCRIASDAIAATVSASTRQNVPVTEHQLSARVDFECRLRGAQGLAYPPVVAGGSRANIIHYVSNNQVVQPGEMVLMDAGCEYHGYCSDITRTWPVAGCFSPAQRSLYEAVLTVQTELIQLCSAFPTLDSLFHSMCSLLGKRLQELGLLSSNCSEEDLSRAAYSLCPHHVSHYLGMDVHDTALIPRSIKLEPGMVITIEPGIYVSPGNKLAAPEFRGLGVRIEDDVLVTSNGPVILTANCPKQVAELEKIC